MNSGVDVALQRRRLAVMLAVNVVCVAVAAVAAVGYLSLHQAWMGAVFVATVLSGFATHIWLIVGLKRKG